MPWLCLLRLLLLLIGDTATLFRRRERSTVVLVAQDGSAIIPISEARFVHSRLHFGGYVTPLIRKLGLIAIDNVTSGPQIWPANNLGHKWQAAV